MARIETDDSGNIWSIRQLGRYPNSWRSGVRSPCPDMERQATACLEAIARDNPPEFIPRALFLSHGFEYAPQGGNIWALRKVLSPTLDCVATDSDGGGMPCRNLGMILTFNVMDSAGQYVDDSPKFCLAFEGLES